MPVSELTNFDKTSRSLITEYVDAGWTYDVSKRGHAILRAPDGISTTSVTRDLDNNPQTLRNARRPLEQFLRDKVFVGPGRDVEQHVSAVKERSGADILAEKTEASKELTKVAKMVNKPTCEECSKKFANERAFYAHLESKHSDNTTEVSESMPDNESSEELPVEETALEPQVTVSADRLVALQKIIDNAVEVLAPDLSAQIKNLTLKNGQLQDELAILRKQNAELSEKLENLETKFNIVKETLAV